ncbi:hypothetical protein CIPAW_02G097000 [Carya illinoinensis]|uniref:Uncharacterized protein n=1 Tax=Carya illinoinensis TaxID=32201 RepID=A0A8T1REX1_CARIL|nr:hypothetical protein CIPAW_02G097000 [Carya illinoinensis]
MVAFMAIKTHPMIQTIRPMERLERQPSRSRSVYGR